MGVQGPVLAKRKLITLQEEQTKRGLPVVTLQEKILVGPPVSSIFRKKLPRNPL